MSLLPECKRSDTSSWAKEEHWIVCGRAVDEDYMVLLVLMNKYAKLRNVQTLILFFVFVSQTTYPKVIYSAGSFY